MSSMFNSFFGRFRFNRLSLRIVTSLFVLFLLQFQSLAQATDLFISEYVEDGNTKYIEIYNGTGATVTLTGNYQLRLYSNGAAAPSTTGNLTGTIADGAVIVYRGGAAGTYGGATVTLAPNPVNFNGDDAVELFKNSTATSLDVIGNIGCDPGARWGSSPSKTDDMTLIRKPDVCSGAPDTGNSPCNFPTIVSEWTPTSDGDVSNLGSHTSTCSTPPSTVTISVGTHTGANYDVTCDDDDNGTITFTSVGTFNAGNVFTAQLSDAAGSFTSASDIGTLSSNGVDPSGTINLTIPSGTASGAGYEIRITSSDPNGISDSTSTFTITLTGGPCVLIPPHLTGVLINSCDGSCDEGDNELVFGNTGDYSLDVTAGNFNFHYGSNAPPATNTNYTDVLTTNPTTTAAINTDAGCAGTYVEGTGVTMPPNSNFILANDALCIDALTWDGLCGQGPIYIIYQNDPNWNSGGNFVNSTNSGMRYFKSTFTTTDANIHTIEYEFNTTQNGGSDGDFVTYDHNGGAPLSYLNNNCEIEPNILPIELLEFNVVKSQQTSYLTWITGSERNSLSFEVERYSENQEFEQIGIVYSIGESQEEQFYNYTDVNPLNGANYYRLKLMDMDGSFKYSEVRTVSFDKDVLDFYQTNNGTISMNQHLENGYFEIYSSTGQLIQSGNIVESNQFKLNNTTTGVYLISVMNENEIITKKFFFR